MNHHLTTDLYQLTMCDAYLQAGMADQNAVFDLFVRTLPKDWGYIIACGIEEALDALEDLRFDAEDLAYLREHTSLSRPFIDYLDKFRFRGNIRAVREGTPIFANEPIMEVSENLIEAQLVETLLLTIINYQTLIASKASRVVEFARPSGVVDFGLRRAPGPEAGIRASRAAYIAGVASTSNVEAGRRFGIPVSGTHAHSFVQAFDTELAAFRVWCKAHPEGATLLIDTYDTLEGARNVVRVAREGAAVKAVRIDSGPLATASRSVRSILNDGGLDHVRIFVSGDMNEYKIDDLKRCEAPIDGYGVGTEMVTARPDAALGGVYKLVESNFKPRIKLSSEKATWPGPKQIYRYKGHDVLDLFDGKTTHPALMLLQVVMESGGRKFKYESPEVIRRRCNEALAALPASVMFLEVTEPYPVVVSKAVKDLRDQAEAVVKQANREATKS